jgi:endonuclease YncB( thermonuclease family)
MNDMSKSYKRTVTRIIDGDTFEIGKKIDGINRIRIADVDTPEIGEKGYEKMTDYLKKLILGKKVKLVIKSKNPPKGKYQARWICYVYYGLLYKKTLSEKVQKEMDRKTLWKKIIG